MNNAQSQISASTDGDVSLITTILIVAMSEQRPAARTSTAVPMSGALPYDGLADEELMWLGRS